MPNISRTKTWNANETLTAADLNAEYNGILTGINDNALNNDNLNQTDDYLFGSLITGSGLAAAGGDGKLHVHVASAGSVAAHANGNDFVIEGTANPGMSFLSGASTTNSIYFGDVNDNDAGSIVYTHGADMAFTVETAEVLSLSASTITALAGITVGVDDAGHDVKIFGNAAGAYMEWDASADQLRIMGASADAATSTGKLLLATSLTNINANDVLGKIDFQAPHEAGGTDAIAIAASIQAVAQGTFAANVNATDLIFYTGHAEPATEKFRMTSQGEIGIGGANYGTDGHVLTSAGAGAAVAWEALPAGASLSGTTNNTIVTVTGANAMLGEANLTFDGTTLVVAGDQTVSGELFFGDTTNANVTTGITINQGAADDYLFALKSSDVAHGVTVRGETDTFWQIRKGVAATGGVNLMGFTEGNVATEFWNVHTTETAVRSTLAGAPFLLNSMLKSGTDIAQVSADQNMVVFQQGGAATRFIFDSDGSGHADVEWTTYSDARLKSDVRDLPYGLDTALALKPRIFTRQSGYISDGTDECLHKGEPCPHADGEVVLEDKKRIQIGLIAQEAEDLIPELVKKPNGPYSLYSMDYERLSVVNLAAIQELAAKVAALEDKVN